jgi:hypothetical protein
VEYFSSTHGTFVPCTVVGSELAKDLEGKQYFTYSVQLTSGQKRDKVTMDSLRLPFMVGEAVERLTHDGPQSSNVQGYDGAVGQKGTIYSLKTSSAGTSLQPRKASSVHMRRRFKEGEELECYLGPSRGWRPVVVEGESGPAKDVDERPTEQVRVRIAGAATLKVPAASYIEASVEDNPNVRFQKEVTWERNYDEGVLSGYELGKSLDVKLKCAQSSRECLAEATLLPSQFCPHGWNGKLPLKARSDGTLLCELGITVEPIISLRFLEKPVRVKVLPDDRDGTSEADQDIDELLRDDGHIADLSTSSDSSTKTPPSSARTSEASTDARPDHNWKCVEDPYDVAARLGAHGADADTPQQRLQVPPHLLRRRMLAKKMEV